MMLSVILLSMLMILLPTLLVIRHVICDNNQKWLLNLNLIYEKLWTGAGSGLQVSMLGKLNWFCLTDLIILVLLMGKWMGLFLRKNLFLRCQGFLSHLNWIGALILSLLLKPSPIRSMKFVSLGISLYLYKSVVRPCMKYCFYVTAGLLAGTWKCQTSYKKNQIDRTLGPSPATSREPLAHCQNIASLSLFYRYYFGRCSSELSLMVSVPYSRGRSIIQIECMIFPSQFLDVVRMSI